MAALASEVIEMVRTLINDEEAIQFPDYRILPKLKLAQNELFNRLILSDHNITFVQSALITVPIGNTDLRILVGYPLNLRVPIDIFERAVGGSLEDFNPVTFTKFIPLGSPQSDIQHWSWGNTGVIINSPNRARQLILRYRGTPVVVTDLTSDTLVDGAEVFLAYRTAALMYAVQSTQDARMATMQSTADRALVTIIKTVTKAAQVYPVRPGGYRSTR